MDEPRWVDCQMTPMPRCPHCGYVSGCTADLVCQDGIERGDGRDVCGKCDREYGVTLEVVHVFTTRKL